MPIPHIMIHYMTFLRQTLTKTHNIVMNIQIMLEIKIDYLVIKNTLKTFHCAFHNHKLLFIVRGELYVTLVIKMLYQVMYWLTEEMFLNRNNLGFQVHLSKPSIILNEILEINQRR